MIVVSLIVVVGAMVMMLTELVWLLGDVFENLF